ncbi:SAM-dependent methyltransferase [Aquipuribacter sp. SD81]|uniref:SAM-dependent methyltransferase n=1 Tax=Aquipuribacter sp. SD81 TaxID=3127703 RepID=UPI003019DD9F
MTTADHDRRGSTNRGGLVPPEAAAACWTRATSGWGDGDVTAGLSPRLRAVVDALPLRPGLRVLEVGGAPGAAARAVAQRVAPDGHVLVVDRSATGVAATLRACASEVAAGLLSARCCAAADLQPAPGEAPYDLAFACRVVAFDGRHPHLLDASVAGVRRLLVTDGRLLVDTGSPLRVLWPPDDGVAV